MRHVNVNIITHQWLSKLIKPTDIIVDATVGNGHDTLFCANLAKSVIGFDINPLAIKQTQIKTKLVKNVALIQASHDHFLNYLSPPINGFIYNLGYLPNSDKTTITKTDTTIASLNQALSLLADDGFICITTYSKHAFGKEEAEAVALWINENMKVKEYYTYQQVKDAPIATLCIKKG